MLYYVLTQVVSLQRAALSDPDRAGRRHGAVKRRDVLGGIIHDYERVAA